VFDTPPFDWPGGELTLNADTREDFTSHPMHLNGEITVEVHDGEGSPLPEWSGGNAATFRANTHCRARLMDGTVRWPGERKLAELNGRKVRLWFGLRHARLFTFEARTAQ
jgi:hypothetical protein